VLADFDSRCPPILPGACINWSSIMKKLVLAAALLALAAPVRAQNAQPSAAPPAREKFAQTAAMTDMFEIQAGRLAQQKSTEKAYKDFAAMIISDHTKTSEQLKSMAPKLHVQLPQELDRAHKAKIEELSSVDGAAFDRRFKAAQLEGHKQAIAEFERYANSGDNADLKSWAEQTLPTLKTHLQHAEALPNPGPAPTTGSAAPAHKEPASKEPASKGATPQMNGAQGGSRSE